MSYDCYFSTRSVFGMEEKLNADLLLAFIHYVEKNGNINDVYKWECWNSYRHYLIYRYHIDVMNAQVYSRRKAPLRHELMQLKKNVKSYWQTQYLGYEDKNSGAALLSSVYKQIELLAESTLNSPVLNASLLAKKGMLHHWADDCKVGWVKDYKENLEKYRIKKGGAADET